MRKAWGCLEKKAIEWERLRGWDSWWWPLQKEMTKGTMKSTGRKHYMPALTWLSWTETICVLVAPHSTKWWPKPQSSLAHIILIAFKVVFLFPLLIHFRIISTQQPDWALKYKADPVTPLLKISHPTPWKPQGPRAPVPVLCSVPFMEHSPF